MTYSWIIEPLRHETEIEEVVAISHDALGDVLVGAYLHGSAVLGGLRADSDLDVLAVSARETTHAESRRSLPVCSRYPAIVRGVMHGVRSS